VAYRYLFDRKIVPARERWRGVAASICQLHPTSSGKGNRPYREMTMKPAEMLTQGRHLERFEGKPITLAAAGARPTAPFSPRRASKT
jgi:hypothetical protein